MKSAWAVVIVSASCVALASVGCQGPAGSPGATDAAAVSYSPTSPLTSNNVQSALDEVTTKFLPLTGGTLTGTLTVSTAGHLDAAIARSRIVLVECAATSGGATPTCNGSPCPSGISFSHAAGTNGCLNTPAGTSCASLTGGACTVYCPDGYLAIGGGCSSGALTQTVPVLYTNSSGWACVSSAANSTNAFVTCLQVR